MNIVFYSFEKTYILILYFVQYVSILKFWYIIQYIINDILKT